MPEVWIDTDMGFDDLAAILTLTQTAGWRVAGLSLVAGNAPLPVVIDNAQRAAAAFDWRFPIHAGAAAPLMGPLVTARNILGDDALRSAGRSLPMAHRPVAADDAVQALADWLLGADPATPPPATPGRSRQVLALGPLTNLARLVQQQPHAAARISTLTWMGGSAGPGNHTAAAEFNAAVDPEAVQVLLDASVPLRMVGLDACRQLRVHAADAATLRATGRPAQMLLADLLDGYVRIAAADGSRPMALYDPVAAVALMLPEAVAFAPAHLVMELKGQHTRGMTVLEWRVPRRAAANVQVATTLDEASARTLVLGALASATLLA